MKKIFLLFGLCATVAFTSCDLNQEPGGSNITEHQYQQKDDATEGSVRGIYTLLYAYGGEHDAFAQRSIDMYGDLLCGDMGLATQNYGWFSSDELMQTYGRRSYFWAYYYDIIRLVNKALNAVEAGNDGEFPALEGVEDPALEEGYYCAQLFALRGWAYASLLRYFVAPSSEIDLATELAVPIYTEEATKGDTILGAPRATAFDVYRTVEEDLKQAIQYFEAYNKVGRSSKLEMNADVARITLAYSYLNKGDYTNALKYAKEAIANTSANLLPQSQVLTTGFNDVSNNNWIWGQDVTVETTTSLASFFGQCDIYSYSYASAGDVKGIDKNLYKQVEDMKWDIRYYWWSNYARSGQKNASSYEFAPDGKFYSAKSKKLQGDRDWLSDNVYMRLELAYLIAAEAACRAGDDATALSYLYDITDKRVQDGKDAEYTAWKATLTDNAAVLEAIRYNWRVELWGEGYGMQTFRRYGLTVELGDNHLRSQKSVSTGLANGRYFTFEIPTGEQYYNPYIKDDNLTELQTAPRR